MIVHILSLIVFTNLYPLNNLLSYNIIEQFYVC